MENENLTSVPEQPVRQPEQPSAQPQPPVQPPVQPAQPQYQPYAPQPQYTRQQYPQYPQYGQPAQTQYPPYAQPPQYQQPAQPKKKVAAWKIAVPIAAGVLLLAILAGVYFLFLRTTPVEKIFLSETELYLKPEDGYEIYYTFEPADAAFEYTWTSSDPSVATVENGGVTAVGEGECIITLHAGDGVEARCKVTVAAPTPDGADIVGTWRFDGAYFDDVYYDVDEMDAKLYVYEDGTAVVIINGEATALTWEYSDSDESMDYYDVIDEAGTVCQFQYYADPADEYYGDLTLYGDWENMIFFTR